MTFDSYNRKRPIRRGAIVVLTAVIMIILIGMVAFAVDYGYIAKVRTDMQRAADAAALAAVQDLIPDSDGHQDFNAARATVRSYVPTNLEEPGFNIADADIQVGHYDPATVYTNLTLVNSGVRDAVRVTLRRDGRSNPRLPLFFAKALGVQDAEITVIATAVLQKPLLIRPGSDVLPIAIHADVWDNHNFGDTWSIYGDGKIDDGNGGTIPGNFGTVDIGPQSNSSTELNEQILEGLRQSDLDALHADGRIPDDTHIDSQDITWLQADPGLSSGIKHSITEIHGQKRLVPIYDQTDVGNGNTNEFRIVRWGTVTVVDSYWKGNHKTKVEIQKSYKFDGLLAPKPDLSLENIYIEGAYSWPVLVE